MTITFKLQDEEEEVKDHDENKEEFDVVDIDKSKTIGKLQKEADD